jgi:hypothetical protein
MLASNRIVLINLNFYTQFANSSALHNSEKNILRWYLVHVFFQSLPPVASPYPSTMLNIFYSNVQMLHNQSNINRMIKMPHRFYQLRIFLVAIW